MLGGGGSSVGLSLGTLLSVHYIDKYIVLYKIGVGWGGGGFEGVSCSACPYCFNLPIYIKENNYFEWVVVTPPPPYSPTPN